MKKKEKKEPKKRKKTTLINDKVHKKVMDGIMEVFKENEIQVDEALFISLSLVDIYKELKKRLIEAFYIRKAMAKEEEAQKPRDLEKKKARLNYTG